MAQCIICGREAEVFLDKGRGLGFGGGDGRDCQVCGRYGCTDSAAPKLRAVAQDVEQAMKVAAFIREHNLSNRTPVFYTMSPEPVPESGLFAATVEQALEAFPVGIEDRRCRALCNIFSAAEGKPYTPVKLRWLYDYPVCFCTDREQMGRFLRDLEDDGCIRKVNSCQEYVEVELTPGTQEDLEEAVGQPQDQRGHMGFRPPGKPSSEGQKEDEDP